MISVILYGRNDSYGYNLHKRAALSLNCIAELLDHPDDEILFVDYNTPDDFPTFPEAIRDTLTERAKRLLRILRVRPAQHRRFAHLSHLVALEPVARNVAVRRSNPANRWLLSTNTDMIFVPRNGRSLSALAAPLVDGYYHLARCELPESLWETLDRRDAAGTIAAIGRWGWQFHLNEITDHELPALRFDAPGDFQLMLRSDALRIWGFEERMLLGYHVDSNLAVRLHALYGRCGDLQDALFGYHCDHTRQVTPAHRHDAVQNDAHRFVHGLTDPYDARPQAETWGLGEETVEEVRIGAGRASYLDALTAAITTPMAEPTHTLLGSASLDRIDYDPPHALPFLLDAVVEYPRDSVLGWFGTRRDTLGLFATAWRTLGFTAPILVPEAADWLGPHLPDGVAPVAGAALIERAHIFVLDGGLPLHRDPAVAPSQTREQRHVGRSLRAVVAAERALMATRTDAADLAALPPHQRAPRRIIGVNAFLNTWEQQFSTLVGAAKSPGSTRVRQGFALPGSGALAGDPGAAGTIDILPGSVSERSGEAVRLPPGRRGQALICPCFDVPPGRWRFEVGFRPAGFPPRPGPLKLEVLRGGHAFARRYFVAHGLTRQTMHIDFTLPSGSTADGEGEDIVVRMHTIGMVAGQFAGARLRRPRG